MNVDKYIPCQVPALCMLSKHPGVSYRFSEYWCHKQQGENWRQCIIHMMEERETVAGVGRVRLYVVHVLWQEVGSATPMPTVHLTPGHRSLLTLYCIFLSTSNLEARRY